MENKNVGKLLGIALTLIAVGGAAIEIFVVTGVESAQFIDWLFFVVAVGLAGLYWYLVLTHVALEKGLLIIGWVFVAVLALGAFLR